MSHAGRTWHSDIVPSPTPRWLRLGCPAGFEWISSLDLNTCRLQLSRQLRLPACSLVWWFQHTWWQLADHSRNNASPCLQHQSHHRHSLPQSQGRRSRSRCMQATSPSAEQTAATLPRCTMHIGRQQSLQEGQSTIRRPSSCGCRAGLAVPAALARFMSWGPQL